MSWLRNSPLTSSLRTKRLPDALPKDCDPEACVATFKKHWQQACEIIERTQQVVPLHDDVLGVVNNVGQMGTLLVVELETNPIVSSSPTPCLEHLLSENILSRLFEWSQHTGRFILSVKQEQVKFYEKLVGRAGQHLLVQEPFVRPLLRLLASCCNDTVPFEQEKQLVMLLRKLCISLTQNIKLLDLFFTEKTQDSPSSFILFTLLIPFAHRAGPIGHQARDALLLCMAMSRHHDALGAFIADYSHICPLLANILSGLYSSVPRKLEVESEDWHRLTPDDVNEIEDLTLFVNTLEWCNAIVLEAHKSVKDQLIELISNGFLILVMGTALLQDPWPSTAAHQPANYDTLRANTEDELITATAYYELFLRSTTAPGLRPTFCSFLMRDCYDEKRILSVLLQRITPNASPKLRVVTLSLLETLISLDCEEVMYELVYKYLAPCGHVMFSQRARLRDTDIFSTSALKFLMLSPAVCLLPETHNPSSGPISQGNPVYGLRPDESLYGNYHAYLCDARSRLQSCARGCQTWRYPYDGETPTADDDLPVSISGDSSGYESLVVKNSPPRVDTNGLVGSPPRNGIHLEETEFGGVEHPSEMGLFLDSIISLVERMPGLSLQENLRITGIISRLAVYPQPLLTSLLLNHSLVFQPSVRSFFQALRALKQTLDNALGKTPAVDDLVSRARQFLLNREERLASMRKTAVETSSVQRRSLEPFSRGDSKRHSFTSALSSVFRIAMPTNEKLVENKTPGSGYKYVRGRAGSGIDPTLWNYAVCAVLVDEWLKELAAIAQEQMIYAVANGP